MKDRATRVRSAGVVLAFALALASFQAGPASAQTKTTSKTKGSAGQAKPSATASRTAATADSLARVFAADSAAAAAAIDTTSLEARVSRQTQQISDQAKQIEEQQRTLESLNRRINEVEEQQDSIPRSSSLEDRLKRIESGMTERPELPPDVVSAGDFPGSMRIPGTDAAIKLGGTIWSSIISTWDPLGSDDRFLTNSIPVSGTAPPGSGPRLQFTADPSRFNLDLRTPTSGGQVRAFIEGDFEGSGGTFRLRHAYGQFSHWLFGQTWTTFADPEVTVEDLDFEGLNAKTLRRQALLRYSWMTRDSIRLAAAAEQPSTLVSGGTSVNQVPDLVLRATRRITRGTLKVSTVVRQLRFAPDSLPNSVYKDFAYGLSASGNVPVPRLGRNDVVHFEVNVGQGIARYINDLNSDKVGEDGVFDLPSRTLQALPVRAFFVTVEHYWTVPSTRRFSHLRSSLIWGYVNVNNLDVQGPTAYHRTNRLAVNLVWSPASIVEFGTEFIYGTRTNKDGSWGRARQLQVRARVFF